ncbi:MAG: MCE family protein [Desulfobacteraceae bacterium]|nr:MAG: MCE family protein [Desulfobacteraceae bacterium]
MSSSAKMELKVGIYVILFIAVVAASVIYTGIKKGLFANKVTFFVTSNTGEKIERGIPVKLSGFKVGQVTGLHLDNIDFVKIEIEVLEKYYKWFRRDSKIILEQEGIIGNTYLKLIPGSEQSPALEPGSSLVLYKIGGLNEIIDKAQPVMDDLKNIVANVSRLSDQLADKNGNLQKTIKNLEEITGKINSEKGIVHYISRDSRPVEKIDGILSRAEMILADVDGLVKNTNGKVDNISGVQDEINTLLREGQEFVRELRAMRKELSPAVSDINAVTSEIREASENLKTLRMETEHTLHVGTEFIEKLNESWLLGGANEKKSAQSMPLP